MTDSERMELLDDIGKKLLDGEDAHEDDWRCLAMAARAILRIRDYLDDDDDEWRHPDFVRTVIFAAGHPDARMALDTFTCMLIYYSTRMFDDDNWGTTTNHLTFDYDSGYYLEALRAMHFIGGARMLQVMRGFGFTGMVLNGDVKKGAYRWKDLSHADQRNRFLINGMPCDRRLRPREANPETLEGGTGKQMQKTLESLADAWWRAEHGDAPRTKRDVLDAELFAARPNYKPFTGNKVRDPTKDATYVLSADAKKRERAALLEAAALTEREAAEAAAAAALVLEAEVHMAD